MKTDGRNIALLLPGWNNICRLRKAAAAEVGRWPNRGNKGDEFQLENERR